MLEIIRMVIKYKDKLIRRKSARRILKNEEFLKITLEGIMIFAS